MSDRVKKFYAEISKDPESFAKDPEGTMHKFGLTDQEKNVVRRRNKEAIRVFFGHINPMAFDTTVPFTAEKLPKKPAKKKVKKPKPTKKS